MSFSFPPPKIRGLMQEFPLMISSAIMQAERIYPHQEIISRLPEGNIHTTTWQSVAQRSRRLGEALVKGLGMREADVVATLAFNHHYHIECYYGISCQGLILHTINPRLFPEQLEYIINHAQDKIIAIDTACVPIMANLLKDTKRKINCREFIILCTPEQHAKSAELLHNAVKSVGGSPIKIHNYEELISKYSGDFHWPMFDENTASSLCYTSGTTGNPKGVLYSHRSTVLHAIACLANDTIGLKSIDTACLVVPLFHVNAWGMVYAAAACGARLVLPGPGLDGKNLGEIMTIGKATMLLGVPTVFLGLFQFWDEQKITKMPYLNTVVVGGSAAPVSMVLRLRRMGIRVLHAWGMSEVSPMGTTSALLPKHLGLDEDSLLKVLVKQGRPVYGIQLRIINESGQEVPADGKTSGELQVRGAHVTRAYFRINKKNEPVPTGAEETTVDKDGWFSTGDISTLDQDGYIQITDRTKDVIKSGGEWISSIDLENSVMGHPAVAEACVIGHRHTKWQERPLLLVVRKPGTKVTAEEIRDYLKTKVVSWWMPNGIEFVDTLPHTATGKLSKLAVRQQFKDYVFPDDVDAQKPRSKL